MCAKHTLSSPKYSTQLQSNVTYEKHHTYAAPYSQAPSILHKEEASCKRAVAKMRASQTSRTAQYIKRYARASLTLSTSNVYTAAKSYSQLLPSRTGSTHLVLFKHRAQLQNLTHGFYHRAEAAPTLWSSNIVHSCTSQDPNAPEK